jgi:uncharacterized protein YuzE
MTEPSRPPVSYDDEGDVLYVLLAGDEIPVERSISLDDLRIVDYSTDGRVLGIEFINASSGVDLSDLPFAETVAQLIGTSGLPIRILA